jgi:polysaccharide export outer membrane protein
MRSLRPILFAASFAALACRSPLPGPWPPIEHSVQEYRLGPGDVVRITVFEHAEFTSRVTVRPDGRVTLPLLGEVVMTGRTVNEVTQDITNGYRRFVQGAACAVVLEEVHSYRVFVTGKVARPGDFESRTPLNVMQALALAGGFTRGAALDNIVILRRGASGRDERYEFSYTECSEGRTEMNFTLRTGDTIIVP